ncbi:MAG: hypothetical protein ACREO1_03125, partial [Arenimonas sp.]
VVARFGKTNRAAEHGKHEYESGNEIFHRNNTTTTALIDDSRPTMNSIKLAVISRHEEIHSVTQCAITAGAGCLGRALPVS